MKNLYFILILLSSFLILGFCVRWIPYLNIRQVIIKGDFDSLNQNQLKLLLYPIFSKNLFNLSLNKIRRSIQLLPEIENISVYRKWPNHLEIELFLKEPVAQWGKKGLYISAYGDTFTSSKSFSNLVLPILIGQKESIIKMLAYTQQMNRILFPLNSRIKVLEFDAMQFWTIELTNGVKIKLGDANILGRLKRWVLIYPKIANTHNPSIPKSIDLRYEHGMAIKWE